MAQSSTIEWTEATWNPVIWTLDATRTPDGLSGPIVGLRLSLVRSPLAVFDFLEETGSRFFCECGW
jgi:hypothetical protein